jgi:imidazolonepropionase-like amidohydrolase
MKNLLFLLAVLFSFSVSAQKTYLHCGKLIGTKNCKVLTNKTIVVSGKTIVSIEDGFLKPENSEDKIIDLKSKTVMPGLIDMHVHLEGETSPTRYIERFTLNDADVAFNAQNYAKTTLMAGFTTVRDLGGSGVNVSLPNAINQHKVIGPRIFTAENAIVTTAGHADPTNGVSKELMGDLGPKEGIINSVDDAKKAVDNAIKMEQI